MSTKAINVHSAFVPTTKPELSPEQASSLRELREAIADTGVSVHRAADAAGVSKSWIYLWLKAEKIPKPATLKRIVEALPIDSAIRRRVLKAFLGEQSAPEFTEQIQKQALDSEVWVIAPEFRVVDKEEYRATVAGNTERGVSYAFWSANKEALESARTVLVAAGAVLARLRFILGPRWLDLSAWLVRNPYDAPDVAALRLTDDMRIMESKGIAVGSAMSRVVCDVFRRIDLLLKTNGNAEGFALLDLPPAPQPGRARKRSQRNAKSRRTE